MSRKNVKPHEAGSRIYKLALRDIVSNSHSNSALKKRNKVKSNENTSVVTGEIDTFLKEKLPKGRGRGKVRATSSYLQSERTNHFENDFKTVELCCRFPAVPLTQSVQLSAELKKRNMSSTTNINKLSETNCDPINFDDKKSDVSQFHFSYKEENRFDSINNEKNKPQFANKEVLLFCKEKSFDYQTTFETSYYIPAPNPPAECDFYKAKKDNDNTDFELPLFKYFNSNIDSSDVCNSKKHESSYVSMDVSTYPFLDVSDVSIKDSLFNQPTYEPKQTVFTGSVLSFTNEKIPDHNLPKPVKIDFIKSEPVNDIGDKTNTSSINCIPFYASKIHNNSKSKNMECLNPEGIDFIDPDINDLIDSLIGKKSCGIKKDSQVRESDNESKNLEKIMNSEMITVDSQPNKTFEMKETSLDDLLKIGENVESYYPLVDSDSEMNESIDSNSLMDKIHSDFIVLSSEFEIFKITDSKLYNSELN